MHAICIIIYCLEGERIAISCCNLAVRCSPVSAARRRPEAFKPIYSRTVEPFPRKMVTYEQTGTVSSENTAGSALNHSTSNEPGTS